MTHAFEVVVAPGCHGQTLTPVVSRHRTLSGAVRTAIKSDRVRVEPASSTVCLFQACSKQPTKYGYGLYGGAHVGTFRAALASAEATWREHQTRT